MTTHYILMFVTILCNVAANLCLKAGTATASGTLLSVINLRTIAGLGLFAFGAIFYIAALRIGSLSISQSIIALQYVGVLIGAKFLFDEQLSAIQLLGCLLVCIGMVIIVRCR